jgi:hypothetical protein
VPIANKTVPVRFNAAPLVRENAAARSANSAVPPA